MYYKGLHRVKVVTESEGYLIVEAREAFEDFMNGKRENVAVGERRIVPIETVSKRRKLLPPLKEHIFELEMEKKLKRIVSAKTDPASKPKKTKP
jgi:hypothetical protein